MSERNDGLVEVRVLLSERVMNYVEQMILIGLWGENEAEVLQHLAREGIQRAWKIIE